MVRVVVLGASLVGASLVTSAPSALIAVAVSCIVAALIDGRWGPLALVAGSVGALVGAALGADHPVLAGALWCGGVWAVRASRGADGGARRAIVGLSLGGGAAGAWVAARYGGDPSTVVRLAAVMVAGLLASLGALVTVDDFVATSLRWAALPRRERVDEALTRALNLRRRVAQADLGLRVDADVSARIERAWASLADLSHALAGARTRGEAPAWMVARVESHVAALERAHASLDAHLASSVRIADPRVADVDLASESLELEVRALDEVIQEKSAPPRKSQEIFVA